MLSDSTLKDLNVIFSKNFIPGSTVKIEDLTAGIAVDCGVRLSPPSLPSDSTIDIAFEVCGTLGRPLFDESSETVVSELKLTAPVLPADSKHADLEEICRKPSKVQILTAPRLDRLAA